MDLAVVSDVQCTAVSTTTATLVVDGQSLTGQPVQIVTFGQYGIQVPDITPPRGLADAGVGSSGSPSNTFSIRLLDPSTFGRFVVGGRYQMALGPASI